MADPVKLFWGFCSLSDDRYGVGRILATGKDKTVHFFYASFHIVQDDISDNWLNVTIIHSSFEIILGGSFHWNTKPLYVTSVNYVSIRSNPKA